MPQSDHIARQAGATITGMKCLNSRGWCGVVVILLISGVTAITRAQSPAVDPAAEKHKHVDIGWKPQAACGLRKIMVKM